MGTSATEIRKSRIRPVSMWWSAFVTTWFITQAAKLAKRLLRLDVSVYNKQAVPKNGPVIVVGGHWSYTDPLLWGSTIPRNGAVMAKHDLWRNPVTGPLVRLRGDIAVMRGSDDGRAKAQAKAENILAHGGLLGLFPSGSISPVGEDRAWRKGFAEMALRYNATIVAVRLNGSGHLMPVAQDRVYYGGKFNRNAHVEVIFSDPILPAEYAGMSAIEITDFVKDIHDNLTAI